MRPQREGRRVRKEEGVHLATERWEIVSISQAVRGTPERPLKIGQVELPCFVLEDGRRMLAQRPLLAAIGIDSSVAEIGSFRLARLVAFLASKKIDVKELAQRTRTPASFRLPESQALVYGYEASVLPLLCDAVLHARTRGFLVQAQHLHTAMLCENLLRELARQGLRLMLAEATSIRSNGDALLDKPLPRSAAPSMSIGARPSGD